MRTTEYPLLMFPRPSIANRAKLSGGHQNVSRPSSLSQGKRLGPKLQRLVKALEDRRVSLKSDSSGLLPEQVLVLETIGPVDRFMNCVAKISGLEWLAEHELPRLAPAYGFENNRNPTRDLNGRLFLVMTDQTALNQLLHQFLRWSKNRDSHFGSGLGPLRKMFEHLYDVRYWNIEDRTRETGILEYWKECLEIDDKLIPFEAELWFRTNRDRRATAESNLRHVIELSKGHVITHCEIPSIGYHAILANLPRSAVDDLIRDKESMSETKLLHVEDVMFVRPVGQCGFVSDDSDSDVSEKPNKQPEISIDRQLDQDLPVVAMLDGAPVSNHQFLRGKLIVDDPDDYEADYHVHERQHGTSMASLICNGDLDDSDGRSLTPLYVRPIMKSYRHYDDISNERVPSDVLVVDLIHRAVRRLFEGDNEELAVAPSVKIINLSICDPNRLFLLEMSSWARLMDWLSWKYKVLFVVSCGNHLHDINLDISLKKFREMRGKERERVILKAIIRDTRNRRMLSPSETINGLSIGATHHDSCNADESYLINPFSFSSLRMPSVVSAHGPGYRRSIKPEILVSGGKQLLEEKMGSHSENAVLSVRAYSIAPGHRVAMPGRDGDLKRTVYSRGTSNATALTVRAAGFIYHMVRKLSHDSGSIVPDACQVLLTKSLLVHSATWDDTERSYASILAESSSSGTRKDILARLLGHGYVDFAKVMECTAERATVVGVGELNQGSAAIFSLPIPPECRFGHDTYRVIITLAWFTPIRYENRKYRVAHLWFECHGEVQVKRQMFDHRAVRRGTIQHEVFDITKLPVDEAGGDLEIKVNCRVDAGSTIPAPIPYGLSVTLEPRGIQQNLFSSIYAEVRNRLAVPTRVQQQSVS